MPYIGQYDAESHTIKSLQRLSSDKPGPLDACITNFDWSFTDKHHLVQSQLNGICKVWDLGTA